MVWLWIILSGLVVAKYGYGMALDHTVRLSCSQIWVAYEEVLGCWRRPGPVYRSVSGHDAFEVRHYSIFDIYIVHGDQRKWRP